MPSLRKAFARNRRNNLPSPASEESPAPVAVPPSEPVDPRGFSALDLRDRVVIMLLFDQIVSEESVAEAWALWKEQYGGDAKSPLWRLLTMVPEIDRELIFAEAARVYGIEEARIARLTALPLIEKVSRVFPAAVWDEMVALRLLPVAEAEQNHSHRMRLIFASHDPTRAEVQTLMPQLGLDGYELRYAPEAELIELLAEAFPWKYKHLRETYEAERALVAYTADPVEAFVEPVDVYGEEELMQTSPNSSSIINFFEDMLVQVVRHDVQGVCLVPNEEGKAEVYFQINDALEQWRIVDHIHPVVLLATIKSAIIQADYSHPHERQKQIIKRWIDGALVRFRVATMPPSEMFDLESIIIRVLK